MAKSSVRNLSTDEEAIALEVIDEVDHGGDYLRKKHTFKHFKDELMTPEMIRRIGDEKWEKNYSVKKAIDKTKNLLEEPVSRTLPEEEDEQLKEIIEEARSMI